MHKKGSKLKKIASSLNQSAGSTPAVVTCTLYVEKHPGQLLRRLPRVPENRHSDRATHAKEPASIEGGVKNKRARLPKEAEEKSGVA